MDVYKILLVQVWHWLSNYWSINTKYKTILIFVSRVVTSSWTKENLVLKISPCLLPNKKTLSNKQLESLVGKDNRSPSAGHSNKSRVFGDSMTIVYKFYNPPWIGITLSDFTFTMWSAPDREGLSYEPLQEPNRCYYSGNINSTKCVRPKLILHHSWLGYIGQY